MCVTWIDPSRKKCRVSKEKIKHLLAQVQNCISLELFKKIEMVEELSHPSHSKISKKKKKCPNQP